MNWIKKYSSFIVAAMLCWIFVVSLVVSSQESTTMDEQAHIPSGYTYVKYHDMRLNPEHPPMLKDLAGLPLLFFDLKFPTESKEWQSGINEQWTLGNMFIHQNNADSVTFWSRFPIILIALLLGFFIFRWTRELAGTVAGVFALALYAFDPNILGHNHYVTTDIGIAAFIFIAFYYFIKFVKKPTWKNTILAGIFLGLAELAKFSAVLLFPFFALVIIIYAIFKKKPDFEDKKVWKYRLAKFWEYVWKYTIAVIICFVLIFGLYLINTWNEPASKIQDVANTVFGNQGSGKLAKAIVIGMSNIPILKGLSEYFLGVFMVFVRVTGGNTYYFFGHVSNQATAWYFPAVFFLKETLPFLVLMMLTSFYTLFQIAVNIKGKTGNLIKRLWEIKVHYLQTAVVQYSMLGFILLYAYLSITGNLNIGFRHLFPILPFAYVLVAKKTFEFLRNIKTDHTRKTLALILAVFLIWIAVEPIIFFPSYISYYNEAAGGPQNGYKYVTDSNTDWGQDLKRLRNWVDDYNSCALSKSPEACVNYKYPIKFNEPIDKIRIDYFGGSNPIYYFGERYVPWHANNDPQPGWYALSATFLQESTYKQKNPGDKSYAWLSNYKPTARIGDSIFVYYIP
jgi:4-amino-4-deoxy-L-arabinose transferase-like glycosyltransferase